MTISDLELTALRLVFGNHNQLWEQIRSRLPKAEVISRDWTGVGFISKVRLNSPLSGLPELRIYDFVFAHPTLPLGGSFICSFHNVDIIEVEGVTLAGVNWPAQMDMNFFSEMI